MCRNIGLGPVRVVAGYPVVTRPLDVPGHQVTAKLKRAKIRFFIGNEKNNKKMKT
jgi:hypothetical protein